MITAVDIVQLAPVFLVSKKKKSPARPCEAVSSRQLA